MRLAREPENFGATQEVSKLAPLPGQESVGDYPLRVESVAPRTAQLLGRAPER
jgi:hypothetical protein